MFYDCVKLNKTFIFEWNILDNTNKEHMLK